ncbi:uncharacterized protein (UPF0548 family) [Rhodococcus sp. SMB37]|uniref:DUF1990 family protein n=1 Tax=Rhodococcus sp. SMB37 TaxID=2512213 RepID=UPI001050FC22|nr:DUF1990 domain-containing protein [Rhodococcus sp. SMB37]TCN51195.1 uncharacterized protein (UPF0548 family) [Rhodococcus sp. SMB37]
MPVPGGSGREFNYPDVGTGRGDVPPAGYRSLEMMRELGTGDQIFDVAAGRLFGWQMHRAAGIRVARGTPPPAPGVDVRLAWGVGPIRGSAWCRVVDVVDEPDRRGFAYGTLAGHPESGEETFLVERDADGRVTARITAFSRPARWYTRIAGPLGRLVQRRITQRYLDGIAGDQW